MSSTFVLIEAIFEAQEAHRPISPPVTWRGSTSKLIGSMHPMDRIGRAKNLNADSKETWWYAGKEFLVSTYTARMCSAYICAWLETLSSSAVKCLVSLGSVTQLVHVYEAGLTHRIVHPTKASETFTVGIKSSNKNVWLQPFSAKAEVQKLPLWHIESVDNLVEVQRDQFGGHYTTMVGGMGRCTYRGSRLYSCSTREDDCNSVSFGSGLAYPGCSRFTRLRIPIDLLENG